MRRGRPRHDDVLTPREWQVLDLLRDGLTNEQIAARLGISLDTAKFHVSEILGKLGVESRQQAAAWQGRPRSVPAAGFPAALGHAFGSLSPLKLAGVGPLAATGIALVALAVGVVLMDSNPGPREQGVSSEIDTGDEALDAIIESVLKDDATQLAARFAGVTAREGFIVGGPVGFYQPREMDTAEWTNRLATMRRTLHAVARPVEPGNPPAVLGQPSIPAAVFLNRERDYDIVLLVETEGAIPHAWRFSVLQGEVIDIITENVNLTDDSPGPDSLTRRLSYLLPNPAAQAANFLVLPPENLWVAPTPLPRAETRPPTGRDPTIAPDGRTGDARLDGVIETLLTATASSLQREFDGTPARHEFCTRNPDDPSSCSLDQGRLSTADWTQRFTSGKRSLYSVLNGDPIDVVMLVDTGANAADAWLFRVSNGRVAEIEYHSAIPPVPGAPVAGDHYWSALSGLTVDPARNYSQYMVLPPPERLPSAPSGHALTVRTGDEGVDRLLGLIEARDASGLALAFATPEQVPLRQCEEASTSGPLAPNIALEVAELAYTIHAVVDVPSDFAIPAQHLLVVNQQLNPIYWVPIGLLETSGQIVGVIIGENCALDRLAPGPRQFLIRPLDQTLQSFDSFRRSGVAAIDVVLDALQSGDPARVEATIDYGQTKCETWEYSPGCPPGAAPGTAVEAIGNVTCHGGFHTPGRPLELQQDGERDYQLYAVLAPMKDYVVLDPPAQGIIVLYSRARESTTLVYVGERGIRALRNSCGPADPESYMPRGDPEYLLPPP